MTDDETDDATTKHSTAEGNRNEHGDTGTSDGAVPEGVRMPAITNDDRTRTRTNTAWTELTGFQRDLLTCVRLIDAETNIPTGTIVKETVESMYGETINHGRLYQNLNHLAECGCIDKVVVDGRTNAYYLTDAAVEMLDETAKQFLSTCNLQPSGTET